MALRTSRPEAEGCASPCSFCSSSESTRVSDSAGGLSPGRFEQPLVRTVNTFITIDDAPIGVRASRRVSSCPALLMPLQSRTGRAPPALRLSLTTLSAGRIPCEAPSRSRPQASSSKRAGDFGSSGVSADQDGLEASSSESAGYSTSSASSQASANQSGQCPTGWQPTYSQGSDGHWIGDCRPCAFMLRGCSYGQSCPFCHLCDPGAHLRLKKAKKRTLRQYSMAAYAWHS